MLARFVWEIHAWTIPLVFLTGWVIGYAHFRRRLHLRHPDLHQEWMSRAHPEHSPVSAVEVIQVPFDLARLTESLRSGDDPPATSAPALFPVKKTSDPFGVSILPEQPPKRWAAKTRSTIDETLPFISFSPNPPLIDLKTGQQAKNSPAAFLPL